MFARPVLAFMPLTCCYSSRHSDWSTVGTTEQSWFPFSAGERNLLLFQCMLTGSGTQLPL